MIDEQVKIWYNYKVNYREFAVTQLLITKRPLGQAVKTPPSQGGIMGSIPVRVTKTFLNN